MKGSTKRKIIIITSAGLFLLVANMIMCLTKYEFGNSLDILNYAFPLLLILYVFFLLFFLLNKIPRIHVAVRIFLNAALGTGCLFLLTWVLCFALTPPRSKITIVSPDDKKITFIDRSFFFGYSFKVYAEHGLFRKALDGRISTDEYDPFPENNYQIEWHGDSFEISYPQGGTAESFKKEYWINQIIHY